MKLAAQAVPPPKTAQPVSEVNASQSDGGKLLLGAICGQANAVISIAQSLSGCDMYGMMGYGNDGDADDETPTDIPQAQMELMSAMKDSAKNLSAMVNMLWKAESAPAATSEVHIVIPENGTTKIHESAEPGMVILSEASVGSSVSKGDIKGQIKGTMIVPGFNASKKRYYAPQALSEAVDKKIWNNRQMYWDHNTVQGKVNQPERSLRDLAAVINETWLQSDGSIGYKATLADPTMESKLTYMQEHGILGAMGVSINAAGSGKPTEVEGTSTFLVEHFIEAYTTDFVTTPGAGGSVNLLESDPAGHGHRGEETMDEKAMQALMESFKGIVSDAIKPLSEAQTALSTRMAGVEAQTKIAAMIESADLPARGKKQLLARFAEATTTEGVEAAIAEEVAYVAEIKGEQPVVKPVSEVTALRKLGTNPVHGMGAKPAETEKPHRTIKDFSESRASALFGGAERTTKLLESVR